MFLPQLVRSSCCYLVLVLASAWASWSPVVAQSPERAPTVEPATLRPGLLATYGAAGRDGVIEITRLEPTIALSLKAGEAAHPRLATEGGTVRWLGHLNVLRPGSYRFSALLRGKFRLTLNGKEMLAHEVTAEKPVLRSGPETHLEAGLYSLTAEFTRLPGSARVELFWQSPHFRVEPLPYDQVGHLPDREPARLASDELLERGRFLAEEHGCVRCHLPADKDRMASGLQTRQGPDLSRIGQRVYAGWLYQWLESPRKLRLGTTMPELFNDDEMGRVERYAVTSYLISLGGPLKPASPQPKSEKLKASIHRGQRLFVSIGCVACHGSEDSKKPQRSASGPRALVPKLQFGNEVALAGLGRKTTPELLAAYLADPLAVDPSGRMPNMLLHGDEAVNLAHYLCQSRDSSLQATLPDSPTTTQVFATFGRIESRPEERITFQRLSGKDQVLDLGKRLVIDKGCNNCHTIAPGGKAFANLLARASFDDIKQPGVHAAGCLADERSKHGRSPWFGFTDSDRQALRQFLHESTHGAGSPAPAYAARNALQRFNCLACHARDGQGGLTSEVIEELRHVERAENSEAVSPPPLTGVGHKLRTPWLRQVLTGAGRARPWMGLRMPQFGEANVGWLAEALAALEGGEAEDKIYDVKRTAALVGAGRLLIGKSGFGCISCHDIAGVPNTGTRGPDLALMNQRVRYDWYRRWLEQPQRLQPGTRMPTVFPDGKSLLTSVLGGAADAQAEAMWSYLSLGLNLPLPEGLEPPKGLVLTVRDRPILLRSFMPDAGARAIAIGYPGGVSLAFDASTGRLAYAWSGLFLDASPVWNDRGGNPVIVLGKRFWTAPPGCPWATTGSSEPPNFEAQAKDPSFGASLPEGQVLRGPKHLHFEGYAIDAAGFPSFRYRLQADDGSTLEMRERAEPLRHPIALGLARRFTLSLPAQKTAWLFAGLTTRDPRILDGSKGTPQPLDLKSAILEVPASGCLLALPQDDGRLAVLELTVAPDRSYWNLRRQGNTWQALLRLPGHAETMTCDLTLKVWVLPHDDPGLLKEFHPGK